MGTQARGAQGRIGAAIEPSRYGMRALVTRPRAEAASLAEALAARGIAALLEPLLDIHYRDLGGPFDLSGVQALLCTSANGVRAFTRFSPERAIPVFAVGEATAARARAEGFSDVHSAGGAVGDLVELVGGRLLPEREGCCTSPAASSPAIFRAHCARAALPSIAPFSMRRGRPPR